MIFATGRSFKVSLNALGVLIASGTALRAQIFRAPGTRAKPKRCQILS
jgi:hypothetical protein